MSGLFCNFAKNFNTSMDLKEKMANKLKELYSNLGFSQDVLANVSESAVIGLSDDADDAAIEARAKGFEGMLKAFQSNTEKRVTEAVAKAGEKNKGGEGPKNPAVGGEPDWFKAYRESQEAERKALQDKLNALEGANRTKSFDELVAKHAKGLGLSGDLLEMAKATLSADMDEDAVKNALGKAKKTLMEAGAKIGSEERPAQMSKTEEDKMRADAAAWVKAQAESQSK